ncbi:MAG: response regulator [Nitrospina sp.]|jgi:CheY-like chemotaxis protein|nr:response regulator [Nitrospina sp.]
MIRSGSPLLVVEDNETDVFCLKQAFEKNGIGKVIVTASNGEEALAYLNGESPDFDGRIPNLILLDLNMPIMNGFEFLEAIKSDPRLKTIPVVILTSSTSEVDMNDSYNNNIAGYIEKPMDPDGYIEVVRVLNQYWTLNYLPTIN